MQQSDVTIESAGEQLAGWLYRPDGDGPHPILVMAHGFSAVRDQRLDAYAERFVGAGIGVLLFDYRYFGDSSGQPRQLLDIKAQLADWRRAVAHARTVDWADTGRLALFGSSFSGGHVVAIAADDPGVAAVVSQAPFHDGIATVRALGARNTARLGLHALIDQVGALAGRAPHYIPAVAAPGGLAVMATHDAQDGFALITGPDSSWVNQVAARIGLRVGLYRPGKLAAKLRCPTLWCVADDDSLCPADATVKLAGAAPKGEIKRYPTGHFEIYVGDMWEQVIGAELEFLRRHLRPTGGPVPSPAAEVPAAEVPAAEVPTDEVPQEV
jgi:dienelactone hydrolase